MKTAYLTWIAVFILVFAVAIAPTLHEMHTQATEDEWLRQYVFLEKQSRLDAVACVTNIYDQKLLPPVSDPLCVDLCADGKAISALIDKAPPEVEDKEQYRFEGFGLCDGTIAEKK